MAKKPNLESLPSELLMHIFGYLSHVDSACLGITRFVNYSKTSTRTADQNPRRAFYAIHIGNYGQLPLTANEPSYLFMMPPRPPACNKCDFPGHRDGQVSRFPCMLRFHLKDWMRLGGFQFCNNCFKFMRTHMGGLGHGPHACFKCRQPFHLAEMRWTKEHFLANAMASLMLEYQTGTA